MAGLFPLAKEMYNLGHILIEDDIGDLGFWSYYGRKHHYYHGKQSPDHPSPYHHWQVGSLLIVASQILGYVGAMEDMAVEEEPPVIAPQQKISIFTPLS